MSSTMVASAYKYVAWHTGIKRYIVKVSAMVDTHIPYIQHYYNFGPQVGKIWVIDWKDAHSPWAE